MMVLPLHVSDPVHRRMSLASYLIFLSNTELPISAPLPIRTTAKDHYGCDRSVCDSMGMRFCHCADLQVPRALAEASPSIL